MGNAKLTYETCKHVVLRCSACNKPLVDVLLTRPSETDKWKLKADCPFCGDHSFEEEIVGGFHIAGYGEANEHDLDSVIPVTNLVDIIQEGSRFNIKVSQA